MKIPADPSSPGFAEIRQRKQQSAEIKFMPSSLRPTLKQIASRARVSPASVSMILRGSSRLAPATIDRVKAVAAELDYKPAPALSALAACRFSAVIPDLTRCRQARKWTATGGDGSTLPPRNRR